MNQSCTHKIFLTVATILIAITIFYLHDQMMPEPPIGKTYQRVLFAIDSWRQLDFETHRLLYFPFDRNSNYASVSYFGGIAFIIYQKLFLALLPIKGYWSVIFATIFLWSLALHLVLSYSNTHPFSKLKYYCFYIGVSILFFSSPAVLMSLYGYNHDNVWLITGLSIFIIAYWHYKGSNSPNLIVSIALLTIALFGHLSAIVILGYFAVIQRLNGYKQIYLFILFLVAISNIALPYIIGTEVLGGSSFLYRSGLDGDRTYFTGAIQAVFHPWSKTFEGRLDTFIIPISICFVIYITNTKHVAETNISDTLRPLAISLSAYFFNVIIFTQSVSIHPYLYDMLWIAPLCLAATDLTYQQTERQAIKQIGPKELYFALIIIYNLTNNLQFMTQSLTQYLN